MERIPIDLKLLNDFEAGLNPRQPEKSKIPATIIGYGEISTIFVIPGKEAERWAFKRMPIFRNRTEIEQYERLYQLYNEIISERIGIPIPAYSSASITPSSGNLVVYIIQERLPKESIGNRVIEFMEQKDVEMLMLLVLRQLMKVWKFNTDGLRIGIDGQLSNWAVRNFNPQQPEISENTDLYFIDTSTPLVHIAGVEQLDAELFLRSAPSFMVWLIKLLFLKDVLTRYYDFHLVTVDFIANFY
ncbi:MAG: DUF6206 family protein, partial [Smithellaceae bacterium]|nr:DUF6206 family protein [Smithellaceae bacterium]